MSRSATQRLARPVFRSSREIRTAAARQGAMSGYKDALSPWESPGARHDFGKSALPPGNHAPSPHRGLNAANDSPILAL